jgi:hypothetical protein
MKLRTVNLRPSAAKAWIGVIASFERELYAHFTLAFFSFAIQVGIHHPKSKRTPAIALELDEPWFFKIDIVASPLSHLDDFPKSKVCGFRFCRHGHLSQDEPNNTSIVGDQRAGYMRKLNAIVYPATPALLRP